ncbi:hypothetical protein R6Q59_009977 [Mikania micrantha]
MLCYYRAVGQLCYSSMGFIRVNADWQHRLHWIGPGGSSQLYEMGQVWNFALDVLLRVLLLRSFSPISGPTEEMGFDHKLLDTIVVDCWRRIDHSICLEKR